MPSLEAGPGTRWEIPRQPSIKIRDSLNKCASIYGREGRDFSPRLVRDLTTGRNVESFYFRHGSAFGPSLKKLRLTLEWYLPSTQFDSF